MSEILIGSNPNNPGVAQILNALQGYTFDPIEPIEHAIARAIREVEALQREEIDADESKKH